MFLSPLVGLVLEIGSAGGRNLKYYSDAAIWVGAEPNWFACASAHQTANVSNRGAIVVSSRAEQLPFPDACFDAVVSTLVLCSVPHQASVIEEIYRVLRPSGRFVFLEHVAAPSGSIMRKVQAAISPLSRILLGGCLSNRETGAVILSSGFTSVNLEVFEVPFPVLPWGPHIVGVAIK